MKRRFRRSIPLSRERQYFIIGVSLSYEGLPETVKGRIDELCRAACPAHYAAFRRYVTTEIPATAAAMEAYIDPGVLERAMRTYFSSFDIRAAYL